MELARIVHCPRVAQPAVPFICDDGDVAAEGLFAEVCAPQPVPSGKLDEPRIERRTFVEPPVGNRRRRTETRIDSMARSTGGG